MDHGKYKRYLAVRFANLYQCHYQAHADDGNVRRRKRIVRARLETMEELEITDSRTLELLADYILATDHLRGLSRMRDPNEVSKDDEEYPPLGKGAREYHEREWVAGVPITIGERRRMKVCEICRSEFIDTSRNKFAKVCGQTCREHKERLRKRAEYNDSELGLLEESRLKRDRVRQDYEYPFYSPAEMYELAKRSEKVYEDGKLERAHHKHTDMIGLDGEVVPRFYGKRKPMWKSGSFGELNDGAFTYQATGRERFKVNDESKSGPVIIRHISKDVTEEQLEAEKWANVNKMRGLGVLIPKHDKEMKANTSENYAIG